MKKLFIAVPLLLALLAGCASAPAADAPSARPSEAVAPTAPPGGAVNAQTGTLTVNGEAAVGRVVTISAPGTYVVSGTAADGQLVIAADKDDEVFITLDGADITNATGAAIYASHGKVTLTLADGSQNALTDGGAAFVYALEDKEEPSAALFSKDDLTINGTGSLTVSAGFHNGIGSKDNLQIDGGNITVTAADDAVHAGDSLTITGGALTITAGDDAIHADVDLTVSGGKIQILQSYEGLEAAHLTISGGEISVVASDDGLNAAGETALGDYSVAISGGDITIQAGGDGIDSNGSLTVSGGNIVSLIDSNGNGALDADGAVVVTGGTVIYGGTDTGSNPGGASTQSYVYVSASIPAGVEVRFVRDGRTLAAFTPSIACRALALTSPDIVSGESYDIYSGETLLATATAGTGGGGMGGFGGGFGGGGTRGGQRPEGDFGGRQPPEGVFPDGQLPPDGVFPEGMPTGRPARGQ